MKHLLRLTKEENVIQLLDKLKTVGVGINKIWLERLYFILIL